MNWGTFRARATIQFTYCKILSKLLKHESKTDKLRGKIQFLFIYFVLF